MFPYEDSEIVSVCPYPEKRNRPSFVNISPTLVIDASMERSSRVLQHGNIKICCCFFKKKSKLNFDLYFVWLVFYLSSKLNFDLYFDLCQRAEKIIQVGLNMHLYDDIWDAPSSLRGSTSSFYASPTSGEAYRDRRLTTNFELWVEIFCVPTCFHMRIPKPCLSVRLSAPREKISS